MTKQVVNNRLSLNFASRDVVSSAPHPHGIIFAASSKSALDISFNVAGELGIIIFHFSPKVKEQEEEEEEPSAVLSKENDMFDSPVAVSSSTSKTCS